MARFLLQFPRMVLASVVLLPVAGSQAGDQSSETDPYKTVVVSVPSPYWGYTYHPYVSPLHGLADVTRAQGDFLIKQEQAALLRERVRQKKLETRRKELEQWEWERAFRFEANERQRERIRQAALKRSRNDPPLTEIWSATSLNVLLRDLQKHSGSPGLSVAIDKEGLAHIHVTSGRAGNLGLLKGDKIPWPLLLRTPDLADQRKPIDELLARVKGQAIKGDVTAEDVFTLRRRVAALQARLKGSLRKRADDPAWNPGTYINAQRFLRQVDNALTMLEQPDAAYYLKPPKGKTVAELVQYMKEKGLQFAPATVGSERHYVALHTALAEESRRTSASGEGTRNPR
jgi:hypothetical protein